jgi:hypothetical protein
MSDALSGNDHLDQHCPKLGHDVSFAYCRAPAAELPCRMINGCWGERIDMPAFLARHYSAQQLERLAAPPPDRACTLVELIERARQGAKKEP